ncbi:hypothetical protein DERF_012746 [Dermatophagoides farinae]|uniref:Uncharacterized protein n=1 Tax=Dermatophagoides farinae TaxID=6954 RepID=A0A922HU26_DERFA|nr:hypothetical protein DERF_012746 [Dermatophagoides farinae]
MFNNKKNSFVLFINKFLVFLFILILVIDNFGQLMVNSIKFHDCSGALVQTVSVDGCGDDDKICRFNNEHSVNQKLLLRYHVDLIANQETDHIRLEISMKSRHDHIPPNDDDDYDRLAIFDNLCTTNKDICPTNFAVLYHFCYGLRMDNITIMHNKHNQEIIIKNQYYSGNNNSLLACFQHSIMLLDEPETLPFAVVKRKL